jgi:hypothetical protein
MIFSSNLINFYLCVFAVKYRYNRIIKLFILKENSSGNQNQIQLAGFYKFIYHPIIYRDDHFRDNTVYRSPGAYR